MGDVSTASMGPPREHGGMLGLGYVEISAKKLQWGRRVNTAEWTKAAGSKNAKPDALQWGRRVNTAE